MQPSFERKAYRNSRIGQRESSKMAFAIVGYFFKIKCCIGHYVIVSALPINWTEIIGKHVLYS